jgi:vacuolar iron transporter family protein
LYAAAGSAKALSDRLVKAGLTLKQSNALTVAVQNDPAAINGLLVALDGAPIMRLNPLEQALWTLFADFLAAAVPILPFVFLPIFQARIVSGAVTVALLIALGVGRGRIGNRSSLQTVVETVSIGIAAALAGIGIGVLIDRWFTG